MKFKTKMFYFNQNDWVNYTSGCRYWNVPPLANTGGLFWYTVTVYFWLHQRIDLDDPSLIFIRLYSVHFSLDEDQKEF